MKKTLILLRHVSGAGSSTFAKFLVDNLGCSCNHYEADMWMMEEGKYVFKPEKIGFVHNSCKRSTENDMINNVDVIIVSNTFSTNWELEPYINLANKYGYKVVSLVMENRHGNDNVHSVPLSSLEKQENNIKNNLKLR